MADLRILHVIPSVGDRHGGPSVALRLMASGLVRAGAHVTVVTTDDNAGDRLNVPYAQPVNQEGATFYYFPRHLRFYTVSAPLRRWVESEAKNFDVIHIHAVFSFPSSSAARAAQRTKVPYIVRPLGALAPYGMQQRPGLKRLSLALIERPMLHAAAAIHCTSHQEAEEILALGVRAPIVIIPIGLPFSDSPAPRDQTWLRQRAPELDGRKVVLFLSRLDPKKGLELLLESFARLTVPKDSVALVVAGDGPADYVARLKTAARDLGIERSIYWAGHLGESEKSRALHSADLFALPSQAENFGIAAVEALGAGLPVILSDQVGIHDAITRAGAGLVVPRDVSALSPAIDRLLNDQSLRTTQSHNAAALARSEFSQDVMTQRLLSLYHWVCQ
jgi:glycosyltransferase involved in cell wall biosynthesis